MKVHMYLNCKWAFYERQKPAWIKCVFKPHLPLHTESVNFKCWIPDVLFSVNEGVPCKTLSIRNCRPEDLVIKRYGLQICVKITSKRVAPFKGIPHARSVAGSRYLFWLAMSFRPCEGSFELHGRYLRKQFSDQKLWRLHPKIRTSK